MNTETELPKLLVHTRTEEDAKLLQDNFNLNVLGKDHKFVHGLSRSTQTAIAKAAIRGHRVISNGLPVDIASEIGEVTIVRAWDVTKDDGSRSTGTSTPITYSVRAVADEEAYERLKQNPDFAAAFASDDED